MKRLSIITMMFLFVSAVHADRREVEIREHSLEPYVLEGDRITFVFGQTGVSRGDIVLLQFASRGSLVPLAKIVIAIRKGTRRPFFYGPPSPP